MHTHGIHVLDRTDDDAVVPVVPDDFHLELLPTEQRFIDQEFVCRREVQTPDTDVDKLFAVVGNAATAAAEGERRSNYTRESQPGLHLQRFLKTVRHGRPGRLKPDALHRTDETLTVFRLVDSFLAGTDQLDTVRLQDTLAYEIEGAVERRLSSHRG